MAATKIGSRQAGLAWCPGGAYKPIAKDAGDSDGGEDSQGFVRPDHARRAGVAVAGDGTLPRQVKKVLRTPAPQHRGRLS